MGILNVDNLRGVGSGTSVTCLSNRLETTNINASGIITATEVTATGLISIGDNTNLDSQLTITQAQGDCIRLRTNTTNNSFKYGIIKQEPYNNNALGVQIVGAKSDSGYTEVDLGGGIDGGYAATQLDFWTAANTTTATGTRRMRIASTGKVGISSDSPIAKLDVSGSGAESVIRARRTDSNGGWNLFEGRSDINGANVFTVSNNGVGYFKGGIDFSAQTSTTATNATTSHEVLDHYEEGSWTPTLTNGPAYATLTARYTRIGNVVYLYLNLYRNESASNTNDLEVTNLPFAMGSYTNSMGMGLAFSYNGSTSRRTGFINTNNGNSVKVIKSGESAYVSYDNFVVNSRALTMKWWYYTA